MCQEDRILGQQRLGNCKHQTENSNNSSSGCNVFTCKCDEGILQLNLPQSWQARLKAADIDSDKLWNVAGCLFWHPALRRPCGLTGETEKGWDLKMSRKNKQHSDKWIFGDRHFNFFYIKVVYILLCNWEGCVINTKLADHLIVFLTTLFTSSWLYPGQLTT